MEITNQDWRLFRKRLPSWQEAYMDRLNREYAVILAGEGKPSEKFWMLEKRILEDRRHPGVQLRLKRSDLVYTVAALINNGVITDADLEGFSDSVRMPLQVLLNL